MAIKPAIPSFAQGAGGAGGASYPPGMVALVDFSAQADGATPALTHGADGVQFGGSFANAQISGGMLKSTSLAGTTSLVLGGLPTPTNGRIITMDFSSESAIDSGSNAYLETMTDCPSMWGYATSYYARIINGSDNVWKAQYFKRTNWTDSYPFGATIYTMYSNRTNQVFGRFSVLWTPANLEFSGSLIAKSVDFRTTQAIGGNRGDINAANVAFFMSAPANNLAIHRVMISDF